MDRQIHRKSPQGESSQGRHGQDVPGVVTYANEAYGRHPGADHPPVPAMQPRVNGPRPPLQLPSSTYPAGTDSTKQQAIPRKAKPDHVVGMRESAAASLQIPRKHHRRQDQPSPPPQRVSIKSEVPFTVLVSLAGVPLNQGGIPRSQSQPRVIRHDDFSHSLRSSARTPKRKLKSYAEDLEDTDSDVSDEEDVRGKGRIKKVSRTEKRGHERGLGDDEEPAELQHVSGTLQAPVDANQVEAPPPGVLPSLWYSRECVLHVFVIEKLLGWKSRPVVSLDFASEPPVSEDSHVKIKQKGVDPEQAATLSAAAVADSITGSRKRMEISRINPSHCPVVMKIAAAKEEIKARTTKAAPEFVAKTSSTDREEVVLVKWRGRSYLHCSWERRRDLEKFDPTNNTARGKIKRFMQSQEVALGRNWKQMLEEDRAAAHDKKHLHGSHAKEIAQEDKYAPTEEEDFFPPDYVDVERVLACDESEMNMDVFPKQRALNLQAEKESLNPEEDASADVSKEATSACPDSSAAIAGKELEKVCKDNSNGEVSWDPEDYVRYVVKFKGLGFSEISWEYWLHLKNDFVDQAEDFWIRQRPPSPDEVKMIIGRHHPHVRDFKKLAESPVFGLPKIKRPVTELQPDRSTPVPMNEEEDVDVIESRSLRLRGYQLEGVNWLLWNWWNRRSCILADEMGLGKTIQSIGFLDQLSRQPAVQVRGPFLVVAPLSLVNQWQSEAETWAPDMNLILYHGSADARDFLVQQEFFYTDQFVTKTEATKLKRQNITKVNIVVTTYEVAMKDIAVLSRIKWKALIVDEAHRLKNAKSRLFEDLGNVPREFCLLLTGTPLQNSTDELWALLNFADPVNFASKDAFINKFGQLTDAKQVSDLHSVLKPYLLRRVKEDVEKSLPPKEETILEVTLTPIQKTYYKAIYEKNTAFLFKGAKTTNTPSLMNVMMELRKCCNHPFLIGGAEERILADAAASLKDSSSGSSDNKDDAAAKATSRIDWPKIAAEQLVKSSGKMVLLAKLLPKLQSGGHKILIFSQMVRVLDLLEDLLRSKQYLYERLDGSKSASSRSAAVDRFNKKSCNRFVMLLSTRAGGLGLNLTSADTVIIFDSDWNPQNDLQAMARAHRIGQTRAVSVYRLLTAKTYEMHMFHSASMKLGLDRAVLAQQRADEEKSKSKLEQAKEIDELLKKGAYDVFRDDDDKEAQQFMETDIDQLLERSSRKVTYGSTDTSLSSGLGSFSKASFVASGEGDGKDVDLDDPDFWEKAVGLEAPPDSTLEQISELLTDGKRSRKQVQQYDPYADVAEAEKKKKTKILQKLKEEKEEKERLRLEKKLRKEEEKERKKRQREEAKQARDRLIVVSTSHKKHPTTGELSLVKDRKVFKEGKSKKLKKAERKRALRRAEREDPVLERIKQAWEIPQRNRATSAALRFGFGRFCKIRHEANLTSLPLQDLEVFVRAYLYQLGLQASISFVEQLRGKYENNDAVESTGQAQISATIEYLHGLYGTKDGEWICHAIDSALSMYSEVQNRKRFLRIPLALAEPTYLSELRAGAALRALRRFAFLSRLNALVEEAIDGVLADLGHEELGKRGCSIKDLSTLDVDLKARHVSTEELSHAIGIHLDARSGLQHEGAISCANIAPWWDRSCDLALIVGTFIHGLGNYEAMRNDENLPFSRRIADFVSTDPSSANAYICFDEAAKAARSVYDNALSTAKLRAQAEAHEAVAAALAESKLANEDESESKDAASNSEQIANVVVSSSGKESTASTNGPSPKELEGDKNEAKVDDSDTVTLRRLSRSIVQAIRDKCSSFSREENSSPIADLSRAAGGDSNAVGLPSPSLPMPNAIYLDKHLVELTNSIDGSGAASSKHVSEADLRELSDNRCKAEKIADFIAVNMAIAGKYLDRTEVIARRESLRGSLCGTYHRSLNDHSDYGLGAASADLASLARGADASRYLRGEGVPLYLTRHSLCALVYTDGSVIDIVAGQNQSSKKENPCDGNEDTEDRLSADSAGNTAPTGAKSSPSKVSPDPPTSNGSAALENGNKSSQPEPDCCIYSIPSELKADACSRAGLFIALLQYGSPRWSNEDFNAVSDDIWRAAHSKETTTEKQFFHTKALIEKAQHLSGTNISMREESVQNYVYRALLPHCLRLCVEGPSLLSTEMRTLSVGSVGGRGAGNDSSPLPDPCVPIEMHSEEAIAHACAILRRMRLTRALRFVVGGGVHTDHLMSFLRGPLMRTGMDGLPIWWCPWIHDLGLLVHAAIFGLFDMVRDLSQRRMDCFKITAIENHVRSIFVEGTGDKAAALPRQFLSSSTESDINAWVRVQARQFPTDKVIERRIAMICGEMTKSTTEAKNSFSCRYDNFPMFDHGGWPQND